MVPLITHANNHSNTRFRHSKVGVDEEMARESINMIIKHKGHFKYDKYIEIFRVMARNELTIKFLNRISCPKSRKHEKLRQNK